MSCSSNFAALEPRTAKAALTSALPPLRHNFAWTAAGNILYAGCQWGMLSVLAKLGDASMVGQFTLGLAIGAPVFMFTNLQLRAVQATDVHREFRFADYFTLRLLATLVGLGAVAAILCLLRDSRQVRLVVFLVAVSKSVECMSDAVAGLMQREERLERVAISLMIRGAGSVTVFFLVFRYLRSLPVAVGAMIGVWFAVLMFYDVPRAKAVLAFGDGFFRFNRSWLRKIMLLGLPLGWAATLAALNANIPRFFLEHYLGLVDQGIYASLAYFVVAINLIVTALSVSVTTRLAHMFAARERKQFVGMLLKLSMLGALVVVLGIPLSFWAGRPLLTLVYTREYGNHVGLLAILVAASGISTICSFLFCGITAARVFREQVPAYLAATVTTLIASALLVPPFGLMGAGAAVLLSAIVLALGGARTLHQIVKHGL